MKPTVNLVTLDHHITRYMKKGKELICEYYTPKGYFINLFKQARTVALN